MSGLKSSVVPQSNGVADTDRSPRRKLSSDLMRIKNFPSTLSLRKADQETLQPSSSTFSRFKPFGSRNSLGADQADTSSDSKSSKRTSWLLDAFKPSKKPPPSFQVVRKPPNRSTSFHSSSHQPSPHLEIHRPDSHLSSSHDAAAPHALQPAAPRISLSAPTSDAPVQQQPHFDNARAAPSQPTQNGLVARSPYPPSTSKTRRSSGAIAATNSRRTSDPYLNLGSASNSAAQSPSASPSMDPTNGSFSLHSFRNVRSASDVSTPDDLSARPHSRVQSMISVDEYLTPGEELPEPQYPDSNASRSAGTTAAGPDRAQSTSPSPLPSNNAKPASISAAKFRQAARQRSESGSIPTVDAIQATTGGSGFVRPPRSRTPSQDLAAMEAVLAQTHHKPTHRSSDAANDPRKSTDPTSLPATALASNTPEDSQRRKRGFFIVVEGLDRAGKSTQVERLAQHLHAKAIKFPERTTAIGQMINSYLAQTSDLDDQAIHLLFSANRWECVASIKKTLDAGESIVCDRYAFSGIAYSVAKGLSYDWCRNPDVGLPLPDLTMFLDLDAETAAARGGYGEERYEKLDFQAKVRDAFTRVSQDVRAHGGRWVTIDASKTLDQVTDDIQKAVQRVTSSIDRVGARLGRLFVSEPRPPNPRAGSSNELFPPAMVPAAKRSSMSSDNSDGRGKSLDQPRISVNTATTNGSFPAARPSGSPLTYTEQLAAVRAAAAGTLSGFFGASSTTVDQQQTSPAMGERQLAGADGPSPVNAARGQGFDSARVLAKYPDGSGRRRTLIDVIGEIENQPQQAAWPDHRRSASAAAESTSPTLQSPVDGFPSTFAQAGRVRRSTDQGRGSQLPTIASGSVPPAAGARSTSLTVQSGEGGSGAAPPVAASGEKPLPLSPNMRASSFTPTGNAGGVENSLNPSAQNVRASTLSPTARTASPAITTSSRSSLASPPPHVSSSTPPIPRPASTSPADHAYVDALSSQHLSMLNVQQNHAEMQEQYMRNYMAMMANPMLAQQAHYQMMLQRHQQQYYGRAASAIGFGGGHLGAGANGNGVQPGATQAGAGAGPPLAAFMQPAQAMAMQSSDAIVGGKRERVRSTHKRTQSSGSLYENGAGGAPPSSAQQPPPMLSMMMAPPPPATSAATSPTVAAASSPAVGPQAFYGAAHPHAMYAQQPMFYPNGAQAFPAMMGGAAWAQQAAGYGGGRPGYVSSRSEVGVPLALRSQRSADKGLRQPQQ
ncbi:related to thymidylate kinase [Sporisorium reilianum SRZ2]|uniref:Thymidylate kinase n=1 Tax=Sporisorium reilianum (strain SRZ2) TaxID=999809 RepID=E7A295_SPORE|nr:related to thymidylate kinase [Sporisorium reilianum SRZ2]